MSNTAEYTVIDLTPEQATAMYTSHWWIDQNKAHSAHKQLFSTQMIMPFDLYLEGLKQLLGRDVHRAEASVAMFPTLRSEYLGLKTKPSGEELAPVIKAYQATVKIQDERE